MTWESGLETLWNQSPTLLSGTSTAILVYLIQRLRVVEEKLKEISERCHAHLEGDIKRLFRVKASQGGKAKDLILTG